MLFIAMLPLCCYVTLFAAFMPLAMLMAAASAEYERAPAPTSITSMSRRHAMLYMMLLRDAGDDEEASLRMTLCH